MNQDEFKVIIAGSRSFRDYGLLRAKTDILLSRKVSSLKQIVIISGHCNGADLLGERYAKEKKYRIETFLPQWELYGRAAGPIRNAEMARNADALIAFWDGQSRGTENMIAEAKANGLLIRIIKYKKDTLQSVSFFSASLTFASYLANSFSYLEGFTK